MMGKPFSKRHSHSGLWVLLQRWRWPVLTGEVVPSEILGAPVIRLFEENSSVFLPDARRSETAKVMGLLWVSAQLGIVCAKDVGLRFAMGSNPVMHSGRM